MPSVENPIRPRLLMVDDDASLLRQLTWGLRDLFEVTTASTVESALERVKIDKPAIITLDLALSEGGQTDEGFALLDEMLGMDRSLKIILITGNDTRENALKAIDRGAFDFFSKPIELEELKILLRRAAQLRALEEENARLHEHLRASGGMGGHPGVERGNPARLSDDSSRGHDRRHRSRHRRERDRQGIGGPRDPPPEPPGRTSVHLHRLWCHPRNTA